MTHLVVEEAKAPHTEHVVPIEFVLETTPDLVRLRCTRDELEKMDPLGKTAFGPHGTWDIRWLVKPMIRKGNWLCVEARGSGG